MITGFLAAAGLWFRTNPRNVWLIAGLVVVIAVLGFVYLKGRGDAHAKDVARRQVEAVEAVTRDTRADQKGTAVAVRDALAAADAKEKLINVIASKPDGVPDADSVRFGCEQLRLDGQRLADLPACRAYAAGR